MRPMTTPRYALAARITTRLLWTAIYLLPGTFGLLPGTRAGGDAAWSAEPEYRTVGYVAGWTKLDFATIDAKKLTHINYAFANVVQGEVVFGEKIDGVSLDASDFQQLRLLKTKNPRLKILISVGGWTWSKNFSDAALSESSRQKFATSAVRLMTANQLDGVDVDWEYPGQIGDNNRFRAEDKQNFTLLLKTLREQLEQQSDKDQRRAGDRYLLTIASGANKAYTDNTNLGEAQQHLDFINIMTYDFHHGLDYVSGHHSNLHRSKVPGASAISVEDAVRGHLQAGVPAAKIVVGVPFYGRRWTGVPNVQQGLYQRGTSTGEIVSYRTIAGEFERDPAYRKHWDASAQAPYLHHPEAGVIITYETPKSLSEKIRYLKSQGLGGVMFWQYSDDYENRLLNAIDAGLN